jgi:hypothetical protein
MKKSIPTDLTPDNIDIVLALLIEPPVRLEALMGEIPPDQLMQPLGPDERSITEILERDSIT